MDLPASLVGLFDPAGRYLRRQHPRSSRRASPRPFVEGAVFGPDVPGGARQATADELASMRVRAEQDRDRRLAAVERARSRWNEQALACARELLDTGTTVLSTGTGTVRGRVIRFWYGDHVLELVSSAQRSSMTRLDRRQRRRADVIAGLLVHEIAELELS